MQGYYMKAFTLLATENEKNDSYAIWVHHFTLQTWGHKVLDTAHSFSSCWVMSGLPNGCHQRGLWSILANNHWELCLTWWLIQHYVTVYELRQHWFTRHWTPWRCHWCELPPPSPPSPSLGIFAAADASGTPWESRMKILILGTFWHCKWYL